MILFCFVYVLENDRELNNNYFRNNSVELISLVDLYVSGELGYKMHIACVHLIFVN